MPTIAAGHAAYPAGTSAARRLDAAFALIDRVAARTGVSFRAPQGVGVGVAGPSRSPADRPPAPTASVPVARP